MNKFIQIGAGLAKNYLQIHALTSEGAPAVTRKLRRAKVVEFFARIEPCRVGMEACGSAPLSQPKGWARELEAARARRAFDAAGLPLALRPAR